MSHHSVQAQAVNASATDQQAADGSETYPEASFEEDQVERSYKENNSGNAQDAVKTLMENMNFLERTNELLYTVPRGTTLHSLACMPIALLACVDVSVQRAPAFDSCGTACAVLDHLRSGVHDLAGPSTQLSVANAV